MDNIENKELLTLIEQATAGNKDALETIILSVQDLVFNLSPADAWNLSRRGGRIARHSAESHHALVLIQTGQLFFHLGIQYCDQPLEKLQKAYVRKIPS